MQGAVSTNGRFFISSSFTRIAWPPSPTTLYSGHAGEALTEHPWPVGPEDLAYAPTTDSLWSLTEHPGKRWIFALSPQDATEGCE